MGPPVCLCLFGFDALPDPMKGKLSACQYLSVEFSIRLFRFKIPEDVPDFIATQAIA